MDLIFLILLIVLMALALGVGFPVAFALPGSAIVAVAIASLTGYLATGNVDAYFAIGGPGQWLSAGVTNFRGVYWEAERDTLIAIPLFVFMGIMLQRSKIAEDLLMTMARLFGPIPGGLGISVVFVGALLAATTGIVGATVVAMGLISLPAMLRNKYSPSLASGTIAASGTLGQIIPPSIVLIILADQLSSAVDQAGSMRQALYKQATGEFSMPSDFAVTSTSAGEMFLGAFLPGLLLVGLYMAFILGFALINPKAAPAVHEKGAINGALLRKAVVSLLPPLALIFLVLGSIVGGVATVNQAGAIGAIGAMVMAGYRLREGRRGAFAPAIVVLLALLALAVVVSFFPVNVKRIENAPDVVALIIAGIAVSLLLLALFWSGWRTAVIGDTLKGVMLETAKTSSMVFIILLGAAMLTSTFRAFGGEELVRDFLQGLPGGFWGQFIIVMLVIFLLGFFLDFIEIAVVVVPIVAPILLADPSANVTAVWLGVMIGLNMQTSFLTPPFGFALFYLRGVAPSSVRTTAIYKGVIAFIGLQLLALAIVGVFPALVNYLPNRASLLSETAPPPKNPRLQYCIEERTARVFATDGAALVAAIDRMAAVDRTMLPKKMEREFSDGLVAARGAFPAMERIGKAEQAVAAASAGYQPLHGEVRALERDAARLEKLVRDLQLVVRRSGPGGIYSAEEGELAAMRIKAMEAGREALLGSRPAGWSEVNASFEALQKEERTARLSYRRLVDKAFEPVHELIVTLEATDTLAALEPRIAELEEKLMVLSQREALDQIEVLRGEISALEGTRDIRKGLDDARKVLRRGQGDLAAAEAALRAAHTALVADVMWRREASRDLLPALNAYQDALGDTIGLRQKDRVPEDVAKDLALCLSHHRDISLNF